MLRFKKPYHTMLALALLVALPACAVFEGRESSGQYVDDSTITASIKKAYIADPQVKAMHVHVETMQGVVQLSGFVDTPQAEVRAVELARRVEGVKSVDDDIVVRASKKHN